MSKEELKEKSLKLAQELNETADKLDALAKQSNEKFYENARLAFQKLKLNAGNVLVIYVPADMAQTQMIHFTQALKPIIDEYKINVIFLKNDTMLHELDEAAMKANGWIRDPNYVKPVSTNIN